VVLGFHLTNEDETLCFLNSSDAAPCHLYLRSANLNRLTVPRCRLIIMLAQQSGTRCQMNLEILTVLMASIDS